MSDATRFFTGDALESVTRHMAESRKVLKKIQHKSAILLLDMHHQMVLNLMGLPPQIRA